MKPAHVSDDRLVEVCVEGAATAAESSHFASCDACSARRSRLERLLHEVTDAAAAEADAVFPDERLHAQHVRILHRIEYDGRPARVIAFPAAQAPEFRPLRTRPAARWIAGAAAAGLAVGLLAGHMVSDLRTLVRPARIAPMVRAASTRPAAHPAVRAVNASLNDEQFLVEVETALEGPELAVLRPLNDLTPR